MDNSITYLLSGETMRDLLDDVLPEGGRFLRQDDDLDTALATLAGASR